MIEYQKTMAIPKKLILEGQINELFKKEKEKAIREVNERNWVVMMILRQH